MLQAGKKEGKKRKKERNKAKQKQSERNKETKKQIWEETRNNSTHLSAKTQGFKSKTQEHFRSHLSFD